MKTSNELWNICKEIYIELFKNATPPGDFEKIVKEKDKLRKEWYLDYYISEIKEDAIIKRICKKHKLPSGQIKQVSTEVILGCSPTNNLNVWRKRWESRVMEDLK